MKGINSTQNCGHFLFCFFSAFFFLSLHSPCKRAFQYFLHAVIKTAGLFVFSKLMNCFPDPFWFLYAVIKLQVKHRHLLCIVSLVWWVVWQALIHSGTPCNLFACTADWLARLDIRVGMTRQVSICFWTFSFQGFSNCTLSNFHSLLYVETGIFLHFR